MAKFPSQRSRSHPSTAAFPPALPTSSVNQADLPGRAEPHLHLHINPHPLQLLSELQTHPGRVVPCSVGPGRPILARGSRRVPAPRRGFNGRRRKRFALIRRDKNSERQAAAGGVRMKGSRSSPTRGDLPLALPSHNCVARRRRVSLHQRPSATRGSRLAGNERGGGQRAFDATLLLLLTRQRIIRLGGRLQRRPAAALPRQEGRGTALSHPPGAQWARPDPNPTALSPPAPSHAMVDTPVALPDRGFWWLLPLEAA